MTTPAVELANTAAAPALLGPQTVGILLRNILRTYWRHFGVLMACSLLPMLPFIVLMKWLTAIKTSWVIVVLMPYMLAAFIAGGAMTVVVSDICVGNRPTVARAYGRILGQRRWWRMLSTILLLLALFYGGLLLLVLPGLWVIVRGCLTSTVVVLEDRKGMDAIKRSFALTKGQAWRIFGLLILPMLLSYIALVLCAIVVVMVAELTLGDPETLELFTATAMELLAQVLITPVVGITMVLLYYDQRVRREAYDVQALAEDLMR
jgi:hypothetical protein